jgi:hypothetical protein
MLYTIAAQQQSEGGSLISTLFSLVIVVIMLASMWKLFAKAGQPGWAAIVPIYNTLVLLRIAGRPWWWLLLMLIPLVNIVIAIIVYIDLAKSFGKGVGFALGLLFLSVIFFPILAFGSARYLGPAAQAGMARPAMV